MQKIQRYLVPVCVLLAALAGCGQGGTKAAASAETEAALTQLSDAFTDIEGHEAEAYILEGLDRAYYAVPSDGLFRPDDPVTEADFTEAVWRMLRQSDGAAPADGAAAWAAEAGYPVDPERPMTRQGACDILYNLNGSVGGTEMMFTSLYDDAFEDSGRISPDGKAALYWGYYNVLIRKTAPDMISPSDTVSRGDMAEILVRFADDFLTPESTDSSAVENGGETP